MWRRWDNPPPSYWCFCQISQVQTLQVHRSCQRLRIWPMRYLNWVLQMSQQLGSNHLKVTTNNLFAAIHLRLRTLAHCPKQSLGLKRLQWSILLPSISPWISVFLIVLCCILILTCFSVLYPCLLWPLRHFFVQSDQNCKGRLLYKGYGNCRPCSNWCGVTVSIRVMSKEVYLLSLETSVQKSRVTSRYFHCLVVFVGKIVLFQLLVFQLQECARLLRQVDKQKLFRRCWSSLLCSSSSSLWPGLSELGTRFVLVTHPKTWFC